MKVDITLEVNEDAWQNLMTPELWEQLKSGEWKILSVGFDTDHGFGSLLLRKDDAPRASDLFQGLQKFAKGLEEQIKLIARRARQLGQL